MDQSLYNRLFVRACEFEKKCNKDTFKRAGRVGQLRIFWIILIDQSFLWTESDKSPIFSLHLSQLFIHAYEIRTEKINTFKIFTS